jgi:tRNA (uracil-5-)-methyltransferase TRM9
MESHIIDQLLTLNRDFYAAFADAFADSRPVADPTMTCILPYIPRRASVLDVGCGNGRLARLLDQERPRVSYVGLDAEPALIERAREQAERLAILADFHVVDVTRPGWRAQIRRAAFDHAPFTVAVILALLHHIPSFDLRASIVRDAAGLLAPGGCLIVSAWQFLTNARMRRKIVDWAEAGVPEGALEAGDYLLDWKRGGRGLRYCHMIDAEEMGRLIAAAGLRLRETFRAGGREGDLSLYAAAERARGLQFGETLEAKRGEVDR